MSEETSSDATPPRRPPASRRRSRTRFSKDPSTEAVELRARLDAIPDLDAPPETRGSGGEAAGGDARGGGSAPKGRGRPARPSRTARVRQLDDPPAAEHPSDPVWEMPPARPVRSGAVPSVESSDSSDSPEPDDADGSDGVVAPRERVDGTVDAGTDAGPDGDEEPAGGGAAVVGDATVALVLDLDEESPAEGADVSDRRRELLDDGLFVALDEPDALADVAAGEGEVAIEGRRGRSRIAPPRKPPLHRRIAFAFVLILLLGSIPLLGREGYRLITRSRAGRDATVNLSRTDPNYVEQVQPTPTAVLAQVDEDGELLALTILALSSEQGGTVLFLPIDAKLAQPRVLIDTVSGLFEYRDRPLSDLDSMVGEVLGVGFDRVEAFDARTFEHWLEPVGEITFVNPDDLVLPDGTHVEPGEISLRPDQVGPYLAYVGEDEDQFSQYLRHQLVWQAWLAAVGDDPEAGIPGGEDDPLAPFIRQLASGSTRMETVPGTYDEHGRFESDPFDLASLVLDAVPVPRSARGPGEPRYRIQLLNGVEPELPSAEVVRSLVALNGTITVVGNGPSFDYEQTEILYADPTDRGVAEEMLAALGASGGTIRESSTQADEFEFTVVLGRDALRSDSTTGD